MSVAMLPVTARPVHDDTYSLVVMARATLAEDVVGLELASPAGAALPHWEPGAHIELLLTGDDGEVMIRHYSLCGDPEDQDRYRIGVLAVEDGRGGSAMIHDRLEPGTRVTVRGPHNHFPLVEAEEYVFIAGGIGITPILSMVREVARRGRTWTVTYLGRRRSRMAFARELLEVAEKQPSDAPPPMIWCDDERGSFDLETLVSTLSPGVHVYACGPEQLLSRLEELHADSSAWALHVERFATAQVDPGADRPVEVVVASTGASYTVAPGCSILAVLREAGLDVDWSCAEGVCGTCETRVLEGTPDHRDAVLTPDEREAGDYMMVCVSRALSDRLVLDL